MLLVNEALEKKNLSIKDLPLDLQEKVNKLDRMYSNFNEAWDAYEEEIEEDEEAKNVETENRFDNIEKDIIEQDKQLSKSITEYNTAPTTIPAATEKKSVTGEEPKKKGSGLGIFLAVAATVALAVVGIKNAKR